MMYVQQRSITDKLLGAFYGVIIGEQLAGDSGSSTTPSFSGAGAQALLSAMQQMVDVRFNVLAANETPLTLSSVAQWIAQGRQPVLDYTLFRSLAAAGVASFKMLERWVISFSGVDPRAIAANMLMTTTVFHLIFNNCDVDTILQMAVTTARSMLEIISDIQAGMPTLRITPIDVLSDYDVELASWVKTGYTGDIAAVAELAKKSWLGGQVASVTYALQVIKTARAHATTPSIMKLGTLLHTEVSRVGAMAACALLGAHLGYTRLVDQCADVPALLDTLHDDAISTIMQDYTAVLGEELNAEHSSTAPAPTAPPDATHEPTTTPHV